MEIKDRLKGAVRMEESPVGEHQSNGMVENGVQRIQGQFRIRRHALEARYGERIGGNHNCWPWLVRHVGQSLNRYQVGPDGKTAYKRWKGKEFKREVP